jgi:hypothetical protein
VVPLKNRKKKWAHFSKMDILKMSIFQNAKNKFSEKYEKTRFTRRCFKFQKNTPKVVTIKFFMKNQRDFSVSKNGNEKIPKILQFLLNYLLL